MLNSTEFSSEELVRLCKQSLRIQCVNLDLMVIEPTGSGFNVYPPNGKNTIHGICSLFSFAESFGLSAFVSTEYENGILRPYISFC